MKNLLLYANDDPGLESRLQVAFDLARAFEGHLACVQATPFDAFLMGDPFGGIYAIPTIIKRVDEATAANRAKVEERMQREGVSWDWMHQDGAPAQVLIDRSRLGDLIVLSLPNERSTEPLGIVGDVVINSATPLFAVPDGGRGSDCGGPALVAWNGSPEASHALRAAVPLLRLAGRVTIVTATEKVSEYPATQAAEYLARHGIEPRLEELPLGGRTVSQTLLNAARAMQAAYVVMGAYGHSRLRETVLGGATREMLHSREFPLFLMR
jgi:nucleotide-binding universal stress UspA family protein